MAEQNSKKGKPGKAGRRKGKYSTYFANTERKKLRNVLKHNGARCFKIYKDWLFEKNIRKSNVRLNWSD